VSEFLINSVSLNSAQKLTVTTDFLNNISTGMIFRDARGVIIDCNQAAEVLLGTSREKLLGTTTTEMENGVVHLDGTPFTFEEPWAITALKSQTPMAPVVAGFVVPDGSQIWLSVRIWPAIVGGEVAGILSAFDNVTREVKEQRFLELLNGLKHLGTLGLDEDELLKQVNELVVKDGHYALAWIGAASTEGGIDILSSSGATDYLYDGIVSWWGSSESGLGPTGTAIRTSTTQVADDLSSYPLYGPWRERVANFNLNSAISLPITLGAKKAALSIYDEHTRAFDDLSVQGLETIAQEIESAFAVAAAARQREVDREWSDAAVNALKRAELSLSESEQWFRTLVAKSSDLIVVVDDEGRFTYTNPVVDRMFGYETNSLIGRNIFDLIHPHDRKMAQTAYLASISPDDTDSAFVMRFLTSSGEWRFIEGVLTDCLGDQAIHGIVGNGRDVTERTYLTRALSTLSEGNQILVHALDEDSLIADLCQAVVTAGAYPLAWVGYAEQDDAKNVRIVSAAGLTAILDGIEFGWGEDELGSGPIGGAIRSGEVQIVNDMLVMAAPPKRRERILEFDLRSMCTFPIKLHGETLGMIAIYSEQLNYFGPSEVETLSELAAELAYGIERLRDVERLKENERLVREAEERFRLAFEHNMAPMLFSDLSDQVIAVNDSFCRMVGFSREELMGHDSKQFTYPEDVGITEETLVRLSTEQIDQVRYVKRYLRKDGRIIVSEVSRSPARDPSGKILYFVSSERDITEERALADQLSHQALHDSLTGLANRALFEDRLTQAHARIARLGGFGAVLLLDLDDFKGVNDAHGHLVGDQLLTGLARRFEFVTRSTDTLSRFGGDEFLYLAEGLDSPEEAEEVAARLIDALAEPFSIHGLSLEQHASIGIVVFDGNSEDSSELIQRADVALYEAKRQNRGRYSLFTPSMHQQAVSHFELVQELRRALQTGDLSMHYQPIVRLDSASVVGFEALMRWQHPERGWVPPNSFIPLAEQSDLILELGHFALTQAVQAASAWQATEKTHGVLPYVTVNLSAHQFHDPALLGMIENALASSGLAPERLIIEITESAMLVNVAETMSVMERIGALGIGFALDDFGTGYSSLSYLALLHPTIIKIDQSFVSPSKESPRNDTLLEAIVSLGHKLGMTMLAEGIETKPQLDRLHNLGCEFGQGFLWSPAVANDKVESMLKRGVRGKK
jgi:diguanylate cyclase (GGDEF)-like protein/PAS domain S-box-containing protein